MLQTDTHDVELSMIGTLPPLKGISPYCAELVFSLSSHLNMEFIDFKKLYPERLYPGGTKEADLYPINLDQAKFSDRKIINFFNPLSWIITGVSMKGRVIHAQWWTGILAPAYYTILAIARFKGKKIVVTIHNAEPHEDTFLSRAFHRSILRLGDEFIVHNESNKEKILKQIKNGHGVVHVIPHIPFTSVQTRLDPAGKEKLRKELGIETGKKLLLFFGNIREYKGLDVLLRAMPIIRRTYPDVMLMIVGQPWENWDRYERIIREEGITENLLTDLRYLPFNDLRRHILASDVTVFPFLNLDSASSSVVLARSLGKPVIVSDVACMRDMSGDGIFLTKPGCPDSLAKTIDKALKRLEDTPESYPTIQRNELEESSERVVSRHLQVYRNSSSPDLENG